jgi:hypothetical protein
MKYFIVLVSLVFLGCKEDGSHLKNGYFIESISNNSIFFCEYASSYSDGIKGMDCKDITCKFASDKRITIDSVILREGVIMKTKDFDYTQIPCGKK